MKAIWKYSLLIDDRAQVIALPLNSTVRFVAPQDGELMMWAEVNESEPRETRHFTVHGTGHPISDNETYIGTALMPPFVWHVYELLREK